MSVGYTNTRINCTDATITNAPVNPTDGANKAYVDLIASGFNFINSCFVSTTANLNAIYNNGAAGVGATLTNNGALAAFSSDGVSPAINARVLVKNQTTQFENGVYDLTVVGDGVTAWVLTRSTDYDEPAQILPGDIVPVLNGTLYHDTFWAQTDTVVAVGVDAIIFIEFNSDNLPPLLDGQLYIGKAGFPVQAAFLTAGSNITITPGPGSITIAANDSGLPTYTSSFFANMSGNFQPPLNTSSIMPFDTAPQNTGGNYNTGTRTYTAPANGQYMFCITAATNDFTGTACGFRINGTDYGVINTGFPSNLDNRSNSILIYLIAGTTVNPIIRNYSNTSLPTVIGGAYPSMFSGLYLGN